MTIDLTNAADFIRYERKKRKLKQWELSEMSGVPEQTISYIEYTRHTPKIDILVKILRAFGYGSKVELTEGYSCAECCFNEKGVCSKHLKPVTEIYDCEFMRD